MSEELMNILNPVISVVVIALGAMIAFAIGKLASFWSAKRKEIEGSFAEFAKQNNLSFATQILSHLFDVIDSVVKSLNDTWKKEMLSATEDGKLTEDEKKLLLTKAIELVKVELPNAAWDALECIVGDVEEYIRTKIENSLELQKNGSSLVERYNEQKTD